MDQAQGAIDAARAAGADRFAPEEFTAAVEALKRSEEAVKAGDYRQALNHALDSRERAQNAAKIAVEGRANSRGEAERAIAEAATLLSRTTKELANPSLPRDSRASRSAHTTVAAAEKALQEARTALANEDYLKVKKALGTITSDLQAALTAIDAAGTPSAPRKRH